MGKFVLPPSHKESGATYIVRTSTCCRGTTLLTWEEACSLLIHTNLIWKTVRQCTAAHSYPTPPEQTIPRLVQQQIVFAVNTTGPAWVAPAMSPTLPGYGFCHQVLLLTFWDNKTSGKTTQLLCFVNNQNSKWVLFISFEEELQSRKKKIYLSPKIQGMYILTSELYVFSGIHFLPFVSVDFWRECQPQTLVS